MLEWGAVYLLPRHARAAYEAATVEVMASPLDGVDAEAGAVAAGAAAMVMAEEAADGGAAKRIPGWPAAAQGGTNGGSGAAAV